MVEANGGSEWWKRMVEANGRGGRRGGLLCPPCDTTVFAEEAVVKEDALLHVDVEIQSYVVAIIERAEGLGAAFLTLILGINLIIDVRSEIVEAVATVLLGNEALDGECLGVLEVDDRL